MRFRWSFAIALPGLLGLAGCGDNLAFEAPGGSFSLTVRVTDPDGAPVAGLRASLSPQVPFVDYPYGRSAEGSPLADIVYSRTIVDVAGTVVKRSLPSTEWDGRDDDGDPVHDGWYRLHTVGRDSETGEVVADESTPFLFIAADPDWHAAGVTDGNGEFTVTDRTYVPGFWDLEPMVARDEDGEPIGVFVVTTETRLTLLSASGEAQTVTFAAVDEPQIVTVMWLPAP
ncbi:MAG TPA: hypothetical protein PLL30_08415 [Candidatus Krumholzibacteria bacterium]|nr:hypothetical protein [Candidatus Krumholzibacteria bacterium]HPD71781.1 hypothetical protein [Candidatus Krumholzibacteria bacterium]HRY41286.1 hypothetical protein [Candidatus Krumholzibacteria bacterium]